MQKLEQWLTTSDSPPPRAGNRDPRVYAGDLADVSGLEHLLPPAACSWCRGAGYVVRRPKGATIIDDPGRVAPCGRCLAERQDVKWEAIGIRSPMTFDDWNPSPIMAAALTACHQLIDGKRWAVLLSAGMGRGKTHLATATVIEWAKRGKGNALFRTSPDLFEALREAYDPSAGYTLNALIQLYETRDLLVIDDLGTEYHKPGSEGHDWVDEKLFRIIDARYQRKKATIITTNLRPESPRIPARIRSRLAGCEVVISGGQDYRREAAWTG